MKTRYFLAICLIMMFLFNIAEVGNAANEATDSSEKTVVSASTKFGIKLFKQLFSSELPGQKKKPVNILISPVGISMALSMAYNGSDGDTKKAMEQTLELEGLRLNEINTSNKELLNQYVNNISTGQISIANSLWVAKDRELKETFVSQTTDYYFAEIENIDLNSPKTVKTINSWVSDKTGGKIQDIVDSISEDTLMLIINAVYFKSNWAKEFNKNATEKRTFYMLQGEKKHQMMWQSGTYRYFRTNQFQTIALPYKGLEYSVPRQSINNTKRLCLYIFLPEKNYGIKQFCDNLSYDNLCQWMIQYRQLGYNEGQITLPKFTFSFKKELKTYLSEMGMAEAFNPLKANFNKMAGSQAWIDRVIHQTFIEVNESGTEAAAATRANILEGIVITEISKEPFNMVVDRPFFFVIHDDSTEAILFMGTVMEPQ